jgi:hypothetical protein
VLYIFGITLTPDDAYRNVYTLPFDARLQLCLNEDENFSETDYDLTPRATSCSLLLLLLRYSYCQVIDVISSG